MSPNDPELTAPQMQAAALVFNGLSVNAAAKQVGVDESTVRAWAQRPAWIRFMERRRAEAEEAVGEGVVKVLKAAGTKAARVAVKLLDSDKEEQQRLAAFGIIDRLGIGPHSFEHAANEFEQLGTVELEDAFLAEAERIRKRRESES